MSFEDFKYDVLDFAYNKAPKSWRPGQAVFNYIEEQYGVARTVQFVHHIDCFYDNEAIDSFIECAYKVIEKMWFFIKKKIGS